MMKIHAYSLEAINYVAYVIQLDEVGPFGLCRVFYRAVALRTCMNIITFAPIQFGFTRYIFV